MKALIMFSFVGMATTASADVTRDLIALNEFLQGSTTHQGLNVNLQSVGLPATQVFTNEFGLPSGPAAAKVAGDTVDVGLVGVTISGSAVATLSSGVHNVNSSNVFGSIAPGVITDHIIESTVITEGTTRSVVLFYGAAALGDQLASPNAGVGGESIGTLFWDLPFLSGDNLFDDDEKVGAVSGTFTVLGTNGAGLFSTNDIVNEDNGTSFDIGAAVGIEGGNILGDLGGGVFVQGGFFSFSYEIIPAPSSAAIIGLSGLVAVRRRRGA
ncbi:MAG: hypothetical protein AAF108_06395 [Planctomycetota bacterium]